MLNKEFSKKDIQRMRNLVTGNSDSKTSDIIGSQGNDNYFDYGQLQYVDVKSGGTASAYIISGFTNPTKIDVPNNIWEIEFNIGVLPKTDGYNEYKWTMLALVNFVVEL